MQGVAWLVLRVVVLALITRGFKASAPEMAATERATVGWCAWPLQFVCGRQDEGGNTCGDNAGAAGVGADIQANLARINNRFAAEAASDSAALVAFPEYATYEKKKVDKTYPAMAEPLDGPVCPELDAIARSHRIARVAGVLETEDEPDRAYNTLVAFWTRRRPAGFLPENLFDAQGFGESTFIKPRPSTGPVVFEYGGVLFGPQKWTRIWWVRL